MPTKSNLSKFNEIKYSVKNIKNKKLLIFTFFLNQVSFIADTF